MTDGERSRCDGDCGLWAVGCGLWAVSWQSQRVFVFLFAFGRSFVRSFGFARLVSFVCSISFVRSFALRTFVALVVVRAFAWVCLGLFGLRWRWQAVSTAPVSLVHSFIRSFVRPFVRPFVCVGFALAVLRLVGWFDVRLALLGLSCGGAWPSAIRRWSVCPRCCCNRFAFGFTCWCCCVLRLLLAWQRLHLLLCRSSVVRVGVWLSSCVYLCRTCCRALLFRVEVHSFVRRPRTLVLRPVTSSLLLTRCCRAVASLPWQLLPP